MKNPKLLSHKTTIIAGLVITFIGGFFELGLIVIYFGLLLLIFGFIGWIIEFFRKRKNNETQSDK